MSDIVKLLEATKEARENAEREERNERSYNPFADTLRGHGLPKR